MYVYVYNTWYLDGQRKQIIYKENQKMRFCIKTPI